MKKLKAAIAAIALILSANVNATGAVAGATEITQWMNNAELVASVAEQANLNATALQQYITQYNQLQVAYQNVQGLKNFDAQAELTRLAKDEARYVLAKKKSEDLAKSAKKTSDLMNADMSVMKEKGMTPSQYYSNAAAAAAEGSAYWQTMIDGSVSSMDDLARKSKDHQDFMAKNKDIEGSVQGLRSIDADLIRMDANLVDMHKDFKQLVTVQAVQQKAEVDRSKMGADSAKAYAESRAAERVGMNAALSNKPKSTDKQPVISSELRDACDAMKRGETVSVHSVSDLAYLRNCR